MSSQAKAAAADAAAGDTLAVDKGFVVQQLPEELCANLKKFEAKLRPFFEQSLEAKNRLRPVKAAAISADLGYCETKGVKEVFQIRLAEGKTERMTWPDDREFIVVALLCGPVSVPHALAIQALGTACFKGLDAFARAALRSSLEQLSDEDKVAVLKTLDEPFDELRRDDLVTSSVMMIGCCKPPFPCASACRC